MWSPLVDSELGAGTEGLSSLFTELTSPGPHWPHPALVLGCPFRVSPEGVIRGDVEKKLGLAFLTLAFPSSSQHPDRHKLGLCLGGHPVWACRLLQRAALPTLETVHKFRQPATCVRLPFLLCRLLWHPQRGVNVLLHRFWNTDLSLSLLKKKENQTRKHTKSIKAITPYKPIGPLKKPLPSSCLQAEQIITLPQGRKVLIKAIH